jgi:toxin ParE1/3/4
VQVVWTTTALRGISRIYDYLVEVNPRAALYMTDALIAAGDNLASLPLRGRPVGGTRMRELVSVTPYIIPYRVARERVIILRVRHAARRLTKP